MLLSTSVHISYPEEMFKKPLYCLWGLGVLVGTQLNMKIITDTEFFQTCLKMAYKTLKSFLSLLNSVARREVSSQLSIPFPSCHLICLLSAGHLSGHSVRALPSVCRRGCSAQSLSTRGKSSQQHQTKCWL